MTNQISWLDLETADPANAATDLDALCCLHLATGKIPAKDAARYLLSIAQVAYRDAVSVALAGPDVMPNAREALTDLARRFRKKYEEELGGDALITEIATMLAEMTLPEGQFAGGPNQKNGKPKDDGFYPAVKLSVNGYIISIHGNTSKGYFQISTMYIQDEGMPKK